ncbi:unnamed protein product [Effrenium voratum]|nr:unnamed protein product [Effrenium voratum]
MCRTSAAMLWQLILVLCIDLISATRSTQQDVLDLHRVQGAGNCPQEASLRAVLTKLGLDVPNVHNLTKEKQKIVWRHCDVRKIVLHGLAELQGTLDEQIAELTELQSLDLGDTEASGDIKVLEKNTKLEKLCLRNTHVTGDVGSVSQATGLVELDLRNTHVSGNLQSLAQATRMTYLYLQNTHVTGSLSSLAQATELESLYLQNTQVAGNLRSLSQATGLEFLHLENTQVAGNLKSLAGKTCWRELHLQNTRVTGNLEDLTDANELEELLLQNTGVTGDISALRHFPYLSIADFSGTKVSGRVGNWPTDCLRLRVLKLAETQVSFVDTSREPEASCDSYDPYVVHHLVCMFPKLTTLDLSGSPLNCSAADLFRSLRASPSLATLKAANTGLSGEIGTDAQHITAVDVDMSYNKLSHIAALPPQWHSFTAAGNDGSLTFGEGVLGNAIRAGVFAALWNVAFKDPTESAHLLDQKLLRPTGSRSLMNEDRGFACYDVLPKSFQISPELFAPERLCSCLPGWNGSGANCQQCPKNTFKFGFEGACQQCPEGSQSDAGATSERQCQCKIGEVFNNRGAPRCGCPKGEAQLGDLCVKCPELNWNCSEPGSEVLSVRPRLGFARLGKQTKAFKCFPPERCGESAGSASGCFTGYRGILCADCSAGFYASGDACERCTTASILPDIHYAWHAAGCAMMFGLLGGLLWLRNQGQPQQDNPDSQGQRRQNKGLGALKHQLRVQAPILLQLCQLWTVVATLSSSQEGSNNSKEPSTTALWELPYIQALQLSLSNLKSVFNLQCHYDGPTVRWASALLAPAFPLAVLVLCLGLELARRGLGISVALKVITLLYIGGASSSSNLLSCQKTDGLGEQLPKNFAFRSAIPEILCDEESSFKTRVDVIAYSTAFGYAVVIPCCLLYLYARQHLVLRGSRTVTVNATQEDDLKVTLRPVLKSGNQVSEQHDQRTRHTVASTAAYISLMFRGPLSMKMTNGQMVVQMLEGCSLMHGEAEMDKQVVGAVLGEDEVQQSRILRCRAISEMLMERCILQEVAQSERTLLGAKELLTKYSFGRNVFLEIVQKLVAIALVSTISSPDGFQLGFGITLSMAAMVALVQPYLEPQVNMLLAFCYLCLALAAWAFWLQLAWLSRAALALPFLLTLLQSLTPDGAETRALRIWEDLEPQVPALQEGKVVEITAETYNFI